MSMNNKQRWMGGVVLLGGGVLLAALLLKGQNEIHQDRQQNPALAAEVESKDTVNNSLGSLTVDVETENVCWNSSVVTAKKQWLNRKPVQLNF